MSRETHPEDHYGEVEQVFACAIVALSQHTTHHDGSLPTEFQV